MEDVLREILLRSILKHVLKSVETQVKELLSVLLHSHIRWLSVVLFESEAEVTRIVLLPISHLQEREHL